MINKTVAESWRFKSGSTDKIYEARLYVDRTTSCNCPGWCKHTDDDGNRECKHTHMIDAGTADTLCVDSERHAQVGEPVLEPDESEIQTVPAAAEPRKRLVLKWR
jgi:hypothetical protein